MQKHRFDLGQRVRSIVTGFAGIVISRCEYLTGCVQYGVKPPVDKDSNDVAVLYHDEGELEFVDSGIAAKPKPVETQAAPTPPRAFVMGGPSMNAPSK